MTEQIPEHGAGLRSELGSLFARVRWLVEAALHWLGAVLLAAIVLVVGLQVFFRYVVNDSLTWTDEVSRLLLVWMVCLGAGLASFRGSHLRLTLLESHISARAAKLLSLLITALTIWLMWVIIDGNVDVIEIRSSIPFISIPLSSNYLSYAVSVGAALIIIGCIVNMILRFRQGSCQGPPWN